MNGNEGIFLVAAERSGTTMLRLMLDSHPELTWQNEFEFAVDMVTDNGQTPNLQEYYEWLSYHRIFLASGLVINKSLNYSDLVKNFSDQRRIKAGNKIVGATVHRHFNRLQFFWPNAKYIHLVRDGRDVAKSNIGMGWAGNLYTGAARWLQAEQMWSDFKSELPKDNYVELSYENLLKNTETELGRVCELIGVEYTDEMLSYSEHTTYSLPDAKHIQSWKRQFSDDEIQLAESRMSEMLEVRGYELSGLPLKSVGLLEELFLKIHDRIIRASGRLKAYGFKLFILEALTRRFGLKTLWGGFKLKINKIETSNLK